MATNNKEKNIIRVGIVASVNEAAGTARVVFPDRDDMPSGDLSPLNRGSRFNKDYWLPDIGEQVLCAFLPNNESSLNEGFILGTHFSEADPPQAGSVEERILDFGDGTRISYNRKTHEFCINCVGEIKINGKTIYLN